MGVSISTETGIDHGPSNLDEHHETMPRESPMQAWQDGEEWHIDVRGLPPPQPLVKILQLVHALEPASIVIVHHDRDPKLLYPELAQIGWQAESVAGAHGEVRLRLSRLP